MPTITVIGRKGDETAVDGYAGQSLMEAIRDAGIDEIQALCGGCCSCATCHVVFPVEALPLLPTMSEDENDLLDSLAERSPGSRLSCQIPVGPELAGLSVTIGPED